MPQPWGPHLSGSSRVVILGLPESGKSTLVESLTRDAHRAIFFDAGGDDYAKPGRLVLTAAELAHYPRLLSDPHLRLVIRPEGRDGKELAAEVHTLLETLGLWQRPPPKRNLVLALDEVGDYRAWAEHDLKTIFRRGRHLGIGIVLASQFATDIPLTSRRAASHMYCLAQSHRAELDALEADYGEQFAADVAAWRHYQPPVTWTSRKGA